MFVILAAIRRCWFSDLVTQLVSISKFLCDPKCLRFLSAQLYLEKLWQMLSMPGSGLRLLKNLLWLFNWVFLSLFVWTLLHGEQQHLLSLGLWSYYPKINKQTNKTCMTLPAPPPQKKPQPNPKSNHCLSCSTQRQIFRALPAAVSSAYGGGWGIANPLGSTGDFSHLLLFFVSSLSTSMKSELKIILHGTCCLNLLSLFCAEINLHTLEK